MMQTFLIACSLAMDAFAVSLSAAACSAGLRKRAMFRAAFLFGFFQFAMPVAGWFGASFFLDYIRAVDHWIAFVLLAFIGGKTLVQSLADLRAKTACGGTNAGIPAPSVAAEACAKPAGIGSLRTTLVLAVATSIDALSVGIVFASMGQPIWEPSLVIGLVTFVLCMAGFFIGKKAGAFFGIYAQTAGGAVLIFIGVRILLSHLLES